MIYAVIRSVAPAIAMGVGVLLIQATLSCGKQHIAQVQEEYAEREGKEEFAEMNNSSSAVN